MFESFQGGRYKVIKKPGEGGKGIVFTAEDTRQWLTEHPEDNSVRTAFLGLVEHLGKEEEFDKVTQDLKNMLADWEEERVKWQKVRMKAEDIAWIEEISKASEQ